MKSVKFNPLTSLVGAAALAVGLAACGGSSNTPEPPSPPPHACAAGPSQACVNARQAELDALGGGATVDERNAAMQALADAQAALDEVNAAAARRDLETAAMCTAATQDCLDAHEALVAALEGDLAALKASGDATNDQEQAALNAVGMARDARDDVRMAFNKANQDSATRKAVMDAQTAADVLEGDRSAAAIAEAKGKIAAARTAIGDDSDAYSDDLAMMDMAVERAEERNAVDAAVMMAEEAAEGLEDDSSVDAVTAAQELIDTAQGLVDGNDHLTEAEEAAYNEEIMDLQRPVAVAKSRNDAEAEKERMAEEEAEKERMAEEEEAEKKRMAEMAATAAKLYAGISAPQGDVTSPATTDRAAGYNTDGDLLVSVGDGTNTPTPVNLSDDDEGTMVAADPNDWKGMMYTSGMIEARVYSNVGEPTEGQMFSAAYPYDQVPVDGDNTELAIDVTANGVLPRIDIPSLENLEVGWRLFELPTNTVRVMLDGSYHGVPGTYHCAPVSGSVCAAQKTASGFTLGGVTTGATPTFATSGGTWRFIATDVSTRLMDTPDTDYASYGWWIHKSEDDETYSASAFVANRGTVAAAAGITGLMGMAKYTGGAAGKYALRSSTGGTNDAGHFTAKATLEANFNDDMITGTIDMFVGADGQRRDDWKVELMKQGIGDTGIILGTDGTGTAMMTKWTIGETAADAAGSWSGSLYENGDDDGVPQIATGTFNSEYGTAGKMVGAFGVERE